METGKTGKYLKYAIGEIVLVVIGILIALQINNWNEQRLDGIKEDRTLLEIKDNLNEDLQTIENILNKNEEKIKAVDSGFYFMTLMKKQPIHVRNFSTSMPILSSYDLFNPTRVAFDNMTSSGNIDILRSNELRKEISKYYSSTLLHTIQDQLIVTTQGFLNNIAPKIVNKDLIKFTFNLDFDLRSNEDIEIYNDPYVISDLYVMRNKTRAHNKVLLELKTQIETLIIGIDTYRSKT